jgi:histidine triad (HIT) family protein
MDYHEFINPLTRTYLPDPTREQAVKAKKKKRTPPPPPEPPPPPPPPLRPPLDDALHATEIRRPKYTGNTPQRARMHWLGVHYQIIDREAVYRRDGWICHICGDPIDDSTRDSLNTLRPTVDHIVPSSLGGDHAYWNLAASHDICNGDKGNDPSAVDLRMLLPPPPNGESRHPRQRGEIVMKHPARDCVFCKKFVAGDYDTENHGCFTFEPLNPVTPGHTLVVPIPHSKNAAAAPELAAAAMRYAAELIRSRGIQANIITSIGTDATQTIEHIHIHIVPRTADDGLTLPWTGQTPKDPAA